ncbi:MAG: hypothetical protein MUC40_09850 [Akkermansiaceae bacterium]|nr:hypothetical protein [Akkermansiaceae bacterium]
MKQPVRVFSDLHLGHSVSRIGRVSALRPLIAGAGTVIFNGDTWQELAEPLLRAGAPWKREVMAGSRLVDAIWSRYPGADRDPVLRLEVAREVARELCSVEYPLGRHILQRAWDAVTPPQRALWMLDAWFTQGPAGGRFCERYFPNAEVLVIGHFHHSGCWRSGGRTVINTGSFLDPGRAHWVEWNDGWLVQGEIHEGPGACQAGRRLATWRF